MGFLDHVLSRPKPQPQVEPSKTSKVLPEKKSTPLGNVTWLPSTKIVLAAVGILTMLGGGYLTYRHPAPSVPNYTPKIIISPQIVTPASPGSTSISNAYESVPIIIGCAFFAGVIGFVVYKNIGKEKDNKKILKDTTILQNSEPIQKSVDDSIEVFLKTSSADKHLVDAVTTALITRLTTPNHEHPAFDLVINAFEKLLEIDQDAALQIGKTCIRVLNDGHDLDLIDIATIHHNNQLDLKPSTDAEETCAKIINLSLQHKIKYRLILECLENTKTCKHDPKKYNEWKAPINFLHTFKNSFLIKFLEACASLTFEEYKEFQQKIVGRLNKGFSAINLILKKEKEPIIEEVIAPAIQILDIFLGAKNYGMVFSLINSCVLMSHLFEKMLDHAKNILSEHSPNMLKELKQKEEWRKRIINELETSLEKRDFNIFFNSITKYYHFHSDFFKNTLADYTDFIKKHSPETLEKIEKFVALKESIAKSDYNRFYEILTQCNSLPGNFFKEMLDRFTFTLQRDSPQTLENLKNFTSKKLEDLSANKNYEQFYTVLNQCYSLPGNFYNEMLNKFSVYLNGSPETFDKLKTSAQFKSNDFQNKTKKVDPDELIDSFFLIEDSSKTLTLW